MRRMREADCIEAGISSVIGGALFDGMDVRDVIEWHQINRSGRPSDSPDLFRKVTVAGADGVWSRDTRIADHRAQPVGRMDQNVAVQHPQARIVGQKANVPGDGHANSYEVNRGRLAVAGRPIRRPVRLGQNTREAGGKGAILPSAYGSTPRHRSGP